MIQMPLEELLDKLASGHNAHLLGPEVVTPAQGIDDWRPGKLLRCAAFDIHLARGPARIAVKPRETTWSLVVPLRGTVEATLAGVPDGVMLTPGDLVLLAPGATVHLVLERAAGLATLSSPPRPVAPLMASPSEPSIPQGLSWLVRRGDMEPALGPRDKVKIAEGNLWRPAAPTGLWKPGTEVLCEALSFGIFRTGAPESAHQHRRTWELYHVFDGTLRLNVRNHRLGPWRPVEVRPGEALVLPPGAAHIVDQASKHLTMAFQAPPSIGDREVVSFTPGKPSLDLPFFD